MSAETPMMKQYKEIKKDYEDSILFYRLGDFYEMFFNDAVIASKELGLTLTKRNKEKGVDVPLAGIPYHSAGPYIAKLINKGYKVAICEQTEDPKKAKGIVKREVIRIITPGTVIDTEYLDDKKNNYLLGIKIKDNCAGLAYVDITTGEFVTTEIKSNEIIFKIVGEINKINPTEILLETSTYDKYYNEIKKYFFDDALKIGRFAETKEPEKFIKDYFGIISLESFGMLKKPLSTAISAIVLDYIDELQKGNDLPISKIIYRDSAEIMELNLTTQRNLEIMDNYRDRTTAGTLIWVLDQCMTPMGSRLLKVFAKNPLLNINLIKERQKSVDYFVKRALIRESVRESLKDIYDVERIIGKLILGNENAKDLIALKLSINSSFEISKILKDDCFFSVNKEKLVRIYNCIDRIIVEDPPFSIREGGIIKEGYNQELDELRLISRDGKSYIEQLEKRERENTGIKGLKIGYNKVFGYYIEVTRTNDSKVPPEYIRKQTLSNAERYIVPDLKEYEEKILNAKDKIETLEYNLFKELTEEIKKYREVLQDLSYKISYLDVMSNFAYIAIKNSYVKPEFTDDLSMKIIGGRHPVVEKLIPVGDYIKNDVVFDENKNIIILTGPNMSGKSTYMKQNALIIIMAHIGCYVPADSARISLVDKVFTRIGASDDLLSGQSTFMLEMSEVANILNTATEKSFIILDEIGRGTSTFDGISIATAITEYIHEKIGAKTIFATHYHELTQLEANLSKTANYRIEVKEAGNEIIFLREIVKGGADKSYGIEVAKLAGLPRIVLDRSKVILEKLEERKELIEEKIDGKQMVLFERADLSPYEKAMLEERRKKEEENKFREKERERKEKLLLSNLMDIQLDNITPIEALLKLNELKKILDRG
ncbi:DNA mismatch repair protein MutS [Fusobacterium sp. PH5-44]|uniref:DNA mismatch repair protein MutS n=1 Tax=unclassified Fusobacterium TaxID=2648384 RepID=UPI003D201E54